MRALLLAVILLISACPVHADEEVLHYNIINLDAAAAKEVANDVMVAVMQASVRKNSAAEAGKAVNEMMAWADSVLADKSSIKHRTMNYQTRPVYQKSAITDWSVTQQLRLQSEDFDALTGVIGTLQQHLQVSSIQFTISPERRKQEVEELIVAALEAFGARAALISKTLKAKDYRIVNLAITDTPGHTPYRGGMQMEAMAVKAAAPVVEAGDSKVEVSVQGKIQIVF